MGKLLALVLFILIASAALYHFLPGHSEHQLSVSVIPPAKANKDFVAARLKSQATNAFAYVQNKKLSTRYCFLIDMSLPSGKNRFFIYDFHGDSATSAGLVAHGSCNSYFLAKARFSNTPNCGCSSTGKYKVGYKYNGRFGKAFKLYGLEESNSNAFDRAIVLHAYDCVPDQELYPEFLCNSLGCPMVSYAFLDKLSWYIEQAGKPVLLWIYN